jgi:hypothetical protein
MSSAGFKPAIPAIKRLYSYALDSKAIGIGPSRPCGASFQKTVPLIVTVLIASHLMHMCMMYTVYSHQTATAVTYVYNFSSCDQDYILNASSGTAPQKGRHKNKGKIKNKKQINFTLEQAMKAQREAEV